MGRFWVNKWKLCCLEKGLHICKVWSKYKQNKVKPPKNNEREKITMRVKGAEYRNRQTHALWSVGI